MKDYRHIHFIGIGGIGISALAYLGLSEGKTITGSDIEGSDLTDDLKTSGARIDIGHNSQNLSESAELVIYSEAIDRDNPEFTKAKSLGIPCLSYFEALGQLSGTKKTIAVAGTHGKTTTTAMLGLAAVRANLDPTVIVGSKVKEFDGHNIRMGEGELLIVEACEYRRSFLNLKSFGVVLLNCEAEHLDYYRDERDYVDAYIELVKKIPVDGFLVANMDDENVRMVTEHCAAEVIPVRATDINNLNLDLKVLGDFNQFNAAHAYKTLEKFGVDDLTIREGLSEFRGTWRRMEFRGEINGALLIDDYGHHPTEIDVTLTAIKQKYPEKRLICVFQPHQYSRTRLLIDRFSDAFKSADKVIISDIYEVRDSKNDKQSINTQTFVKAIQHPAVEWGKDLDNTYRLIKTNVKKGDIVVTMGAGSIGKLADQLAE